MEKYTNDTLCMDTSSILFNKVDRNPKHVVNCICSVTKQYMYRQRCAATVLSANELEHLIFHYKNIEYFNAKRSNMLKKFDQKWNSK